MVLLDLFLSNFEIKLSDIFNFNIYWLKAIGDPSRELMIYGSLLSLS